MSEGLFLFNDQVKDKDFGKINLKEAIYRSRVKLCEFNGMKMESLNDRPFLKFFNRPKLYSFDLRINRKAIVKGNTPRNTFVVKTSK